jgi:hypothetical protein
MRAGLGVTVLLVFIAGSAFADEQLRADAAFARGVENRTRVLVARKDFADAADRYRALHELGVRSPGLYLALGNAATLADRWPEAIWAYQQGLKLDPNNTDLRAHLAFVRAKVIYPPANLGRPEPDLWPAWLYRPTEYEFILVGGLSYVLACLLATIGCVRGSARLLVAASVLIGIATGAGLGYWHASRQEIFDQEMPRIVLLHNTSFQRGNGASYPQHPILPVLPRGMEARRLHTRGGWLAIRLSTGEVGWIPANAALVVQ